MLYHTFTERKVLKLKFRIIIIVIKYLKAELNSVGIAKE